MAHPLRVLVVDDNPHDRRLVVREIRREYADAEILEAIDQDQLESHLAEARFDVVVTDYHLHWSDGIRVLQAVKKRKPTCPVIMFTGTGSEEVAVHAMKQGLDDYIIKNVRHLVRLRGAVRASLENAQTRQRAETLESRLQSLLSQLRVGVFSCTSDGKFSYVNSAMAEFLNSVADANHTNLESLFPTTIEAQEFLQSVSSSLAPSEYEVEIYVSGSGAKYYRLSAKLAAPANSTARIDGLVEDITQRKKSEAIARKAAVAAAQLAMLSPREDDVLSEVVAGSANKVIARRLDISEKTVEKHRSSLMKKLRVRSVAQLVRLAMLAEAEPANHADDGLLDGTDGAPHR